MTVRCPECGTINSGQSKFCSDCGHQIRPQTAGRCPECGAPNPPNNIFCDECGHRLVPADPALGSRTGEASVRGLSLPRKEGVTEDGVPDWLAKLRASFSEEPDAEQDESSEPPALEAAAAPSPPVELEDEGGSSWLDDLSDLAEAAPAAEEQGRPGMAENDDRLPDWLRQALAKPSPAEEESPAIEPEPSEEPAAEWLTGLGAEELPDEETTPSAAADQGEQPTLSQEESGPDQELEEGEELPSPRAAPKPSADVEDMEPEALAGWLESLSAEPMLEELAAGDKEKADQMPDWLQSVALEDEAIETGQDLDLQEAGLPDWLQALDLEETESEGADELPNWLQDVTVEEALDDTKLAPPEPLVADESEIEAPARPKRPKKRLPTTGPLVPDELKGWLGDTIGDEEQEPSPSGPATGGTGRFGGTGPLVPPELPDWLAAVEDVPSTGELPGWLLEEEEPAIEEEKPPPAPAADRPRTAPLPSWLKDDHGSGAADDEAAAVPGEIPDWLQPPPDMVDTELARAELPSWLLPPEESETAPVDIDLLAEMASWPGEEAGQDLDGEGIGLAQAVIPDWLQALKPQEETEADAGLPSAELEKVETDGPLTGIRGALPIEGAIITPPETRPLPKFVVTEQQHDHVSVLKQIIHGGPAPRPEPPPARSPQWWLERGVIPILVLVAVFVPALLGYIGRPLAMPNSDQARAEVMDVYTAIDTLEPSDTAVVAFDYSPAAAGELDAVAAPLLRHLMMRGAGILAVSTVPAGPQLAQTALEDLGAEYDYQYGRDYLILGYIPGGAVGLQTFATTPWELFSGPDYLGRARAEAEGRPPLAQENQVAVELGTSLRESELVLLLTASRDDLIGWMEQVGRLPGMETVPIVGGLSAGLEPWARPYYATEREQLTGLVTGVPAAVEYAQLVDPEGAGAVILLRDSQTLGLAVVAVFVVVGLVWGSVAGLSSRSRGNG